MSEDFSDQRSTHGSNQGEDYKQDSDDREVSVYPDSPPDSHNKQHHTSPDSESISTPDLNLNLSYTQVDETIQVAFFSYEGKVKYTIRLADISFTLATTCEERSTDLVHAYLQQLPEQYNHDNYRRLIRNIWYGPELQHTVGKNGLTQPHNSVQVEWASLHHYF